MLNLASNILPDLASLSPQHSTWEADTGLSPNLRLAWLMYCVPTQSWIYSEMLIG